jgi:hypothetical protein
MEKISCQLIVTDPFQELGDIVKLLFGKLLDVVLLEGVDEFRVLVSVVLLQFFLDLVETVDDILYGDVYHLLTVLEEALSTVTNITMCDFL